MDIKDPSSAMKRISADAATEDIIMTGDKAFKKDSAI